MENRPVGPQRRVSDQARHRLAEELRSDHRVREEIVEFDTRQYLSRLESTNVPSKIAEIHSRIQALQGFVDADLDQ